MMTENAPDWMDKLADGIDAALDASGIDNDKNSAAIFIAVQSHDNNKSKAVTYAVRGSDYPLAEAVGTLIYNRDLPEVMHVAAREAIKLRDREDAARLLRSSRGTRTNKKHKPKNKKR